jgi:hypothetical protein
MSSISTPRIFAPIPPEPDNKNICLQILVIIPPWGTVKTFSFPKGKTMGALQVYLMKHYGISECSVLSNCASFEIVICGNIDSLLEFSKCLMAQTRATPRDKNAPIFQVLTQSMDVPDWVLDLDEAPVKDDGYVKSPTSWHDIGRGGI